MTDAARLRITLADLAPSPWREVEVPLSMTLKGLHDTIQAAFLWFDSHLWEFEIGDRRYGLPSDDDWGGGKVYNASTARLDRLRKMEGQTFLYTYDFGDNWEHEITVVSLFEMETGTRLPRLIDGQWRTPPEDVGGPPGFELFLEAMGDITHEDHEHLLDWYGQDFDPADYEPEIVRIQLDRLAKQRAPKR